MSRVLLIIFTFIIVGAFVQANAQDEKLGRDDFVSTSISSVFDKIGQYTSGEKRIIENEEGAAPESAEQDTDAMGRSLTESNITIRGNLPSDDRAEGRTSAP